MSDKHVRMTIEFDIDDEALAEHGITAKDVLKGLTFGDDNVSDGFFISTNIPGLNPTADFFLCNGQVVSKEFIERRSIGDHLDWCRDMICEEIRLNGVSCHGMQPEEVEPFIASRNLDGLAHYLNYLVSVGDGDANKAMDVVFSKEWAGIRSNLTSFRLSALNVSDVSFDPVNYSIFIEHDRIFLDKNDQLSVQLFDEREVRPLRHRIQDVREGDAFFFGNAGSIRTASDDAHQNLDERDEPWIVYGDDGDCYFEEDFGTNLGEQMKDLLEKIFPDRKPHRSLNDILKDARSRTETSPQSQSRPSPELEK